MDMLDMLGINASQYPKGRAPSNSGFVGGFPVARAVTSTGAVIDVGAGLMANMQPSDVQSIASFQSRFLGGPASSAAANAPDAPAADAKPSSSSASAGQDLATVTKQKLWLFPSSTLAPPAPASDAMEKSPAPSSAPVEPVEASTSSQPEGETIPDEAGYDTVENGNGGREQMEEMEAAGLDEGPTTKLVTHGNFALSSCPGKKVRLNTGPVNGRGKRAGSKSHKSNSSFPASINRDLDVDFARLASYGIKTVVWFVLFSLKSSNL
ncbi:hypothetical protein HK405_014855 [Cladochytrium tenue]|nr:hypothetical protein HK405_014855 [Cladochytrium tenue]